MNAIHSRGACGSSATRPSLWLLLTALATVSAVTAVAMRPLVATAYAGEGPELRGTVLAGIWVLAAVAPVAALAKGAALAGVAWAVLVLGGGDPRFRPLVSTLVAGELILAAQGLWVAALLHLRGLGALHTPADLGVATGLDLIFPDPGRPLGALASMVTPFHLAWMGFLVWRFRATQSVGIAWSAGAALACWIPGIVLAVGRALGG